MDKEIADKQIKQRTCIFCKNKYFQEDLIRIFFFQNTPYLAFKKSVINVYTEQIVKDKKEVLRKKSRSFYFCLDCWKKQKENYKVKQIKYNLNKIKNVSVDLLPFLQKINKLITWL
ncbi:MAG: hypothetical protein ACK4GR_01755 [bacterium]